MRALAILFGIFSVILVARFLDHSEGSSVEDACCSSMVWLHAANDMGKLQTAVEAGSRGVEVDVQLSSSGSLILDHDNPSAASALGLDDALAAVGGKIKYWWLDFKNLNWSTAADATHLLQQIASRHSAYNVFIVESHNALGLWRFDAREANLLKAYWATKRNGLPKKFMDYLRIFWNVSVINPPLVTMPAAQWDDFDKHLFKNRRVMVFTINDAVEIRRFTSSNGASVVLTDNPAFISQVREL